MEINRSCMKGLLILFVVLINACCEKETNLSIDHCPTCSSLIKLNEISWLSKPNYAWFQFEDPMDTFFTLEIMETNPIYDDFMDFILFWHIPLELGAYKLDADLLSEWGTDVTLHVFEIEYGTATEIYWPVYDGSSVINVDSINRSTGEFTISFNLILYPNGNPNAKIHNSTYPLLVAVTGQSQGIISYE